MKSVKWYWRWIIGRHVNDGSKHQWETHSASPKHPCEWHYCHCYRKVCKICGDGHFVSDGVMDMR